MFSFPHSQRKSEPSENSFTFVSVNTVPCNCSPSSSPHSERCFCVQSEDYPLPPHTLMSFPPIFWGLHVAAATSSLSAHFLLPLAPSLPSALNISTPRHPSILAPPQTNFLSLYLFISLLLFMLMNSFHPTTAMVLFSARSPTISSYTFHSPFSI